MDPVGQTVCIVCVWVRAVAWSMIQSPTTTTTIELTPKSSRGCKRCLIDQLEGAAITRIFIYKQLICARSKEACRVDDWVPSNHSFMVNVLHAAGTMDTAGS